MARLPAIDVARRRDSVVRGTVASAPGHTFRTAGSCCFINMGIDQALPAVDFAVSRRFRTPPTEARYAIVMNACHH
ncbi:MAG TPA: hypothetical protein VND19_08495 [Acetobacteraceae bacterium]|nr:hypothetical protein [Acetobacteraceae bacterium]